MKKSEVCLFHVGGNVGSNDWPLGVISEATQELFGKIPQTFDFWDDAFTECKCFDAAIADIGLGLWSVHLEAELVLSAEVEHFEMLDLGVSEENSVVAKVRLWLVGVDHHVKCGVRSLLELKCDLFEALAGKSCGWVRWRNIGCENWEEGTW